MIDIYLGGGIMNKNFSLQKDHYLKIALEFAIISLIIFSLYNIMNIILYFKNRTVIKTYLDLLIIPVFSIFIYFFRFCIIFFRMKYSIIGIGTITRLYEKDKGWYNFNIDDLKNWMSYYNEIKETANVKIIKAITRHSHIQGIEYTYKLENGTEYKRKQYLRGVSFPLLYEQISENNEVKIKICNNNKTKSYMY